MNDQAPAPSERSGSRGFEAHGLTKRYGAFLALDHVDFHIHRGEILGYLGPNGSGKSTTVNTVVGLIEPSAGSLWLDGLRMLEDPVAYKRRIGYVPEEPYLYTHMTAVEYLMLVGRLRGLTEAVLAEKVPAFLQLLSLWDSRYVTMAAYSKGMRQRVLLAAALLHNPDLLVLDEPFSGLDVPAGLLFRTLLKLFAASGRMVLFSTHRFDMVEQLCSRVVILSAGRIVAEHEVATLRDEGSPSLEEVFVRSTGQDDFTPLARQILSLVQP
jgi:ABC-2 type transport system ATP-binding protein